MSGWPGECQECAAGGAAGAEVMPSADSVQKVEVASSNAFVQC